MRPVPGSEFASFLETLSPNDPRRYVINPVKPGFGGPRHQGNFIGGPFGNGGVRPIEGGTPALPNFINQPTTQMPSSPVGTVNNGVRGGGDFTLTGMAQQPVQQPMQNPLGGGLSSLNQQPFGMNQQPLQMNGGLKSILDNYMNNYINNYFMNALK
jgi:hypothetical protein